MKPVVGPGFVEEPLLDEDPVAGIASLTLEAGQVRPTERLAPLSDYEGGTTEDELNEAVASDRYTTPLDSSSSGQGLFVTTYLTDSFPEKQAVCPESF